MKKFLIIFVGFIGLVFIVSHSYAADSGTTITFDVMPGVSPKILPADYKMPVVLTVTMDIVKYGTFCSDNNTTSFLWSVYEEYPGTLDQFIFPGGLTGKVETFNRNTTVITKSLTTTVTALPYPEGDSSIVMPIYALIECGNTNSLGAHINVAQSAPVNVTISRGDLIYACVAPNGKYSCSQGNLSSCSDVVGGGPQCRQTCAQIKSSLCGSTAPTGPGDGTCNNNGACDANETSSSCPSDCPVVPGASQSYFFSIPNPLKGGASDLASLVRVIAQWIFNLAIPIAVVMIVYAGVLFLMAQGSEQKVTKAKDVLKWAVVGLAIILIGSGFITLIQSVLELGENAPPVEEPLLPIGPHLCNDGVCSNGVEGPCQNDSDCEQAPSVGAVGNRCDNNRDCLYVLRCGSGNICQRPAGNLEEEWCNNGANCVVGLTCDKTIEVSRVIDGQTLGTCSQMSDSEPE